MQEASVITKSRWGQPPTVTPQPRLPGGFCARYGRGAPEMERSPGSPQIVGELMRES